MGGVSRVGGSFVALFSVLVAFAFVTSTPATASKPQRALPGLTVASAETAFRSTWPGFLSGFDHANVDQLQAYGTSQMTEAAVGSLACGCGPWLWSRYRVRFSIPPEDTYPLSFLAEVAFTGPRPADAFAEDAVLTKAAPNSRWRVAYMVDYSGPATYVGPSKVALAPPVPFDLKSVGSEFATYFQDVVESGNPPPTGLAWPLTGALRQDVDDDVQTVQNIVDGGASAHMTFSALNGSIPFAFPGGDIICGALKSTLTAQAAPNEPMTQSAGRSPWGPLLAPGSYSSVVEYGVHDFCATISPNGVVTPISFFGNAYEKVGVKAEGISI